MTKLTKIANYLVRKYGEEMGKDSIINVLNSMNWEEIEGNREYQIMLGRTQKDVIIKDGKAYFEVPVFCLITDGDIDDQMVISCELNLSDNSLSFSKDVLNAQGTPYVPPGSTSEGWLEGEGGMLEWYYDAINLIRSHFAGKPKDIPALKMDRYLRGF